MNTVVFDLDGTLLDSRERHTVLLRDICREQCIPITPQMLRGYLPSKQNGLSTLQYLIKICGFSTIQAQECNKLWIERIETWEYLLLDIVYFDTLEFLETLKENNLDLVLVTARQKERLLMQQLDKLKIQHFFSQVFCVSPMKAKEKKQNIIKNLIHVTGVIGDTEVDYFAAIHAGCHFFAMNRGFRSKAYWDDQRIQSFGNFEELLAYGGIIN